MKAEGAVNLQGSKLNNIQIHHEAANATTN
jgi:hypothetical protein